jgi:hypothetical protein
MRHPPVRNRVDGAIAVIGLSARSGLALAGGLRRLRAHFFVVLLCLLQMFVPRYSLGLIHSNGFPFFGILVFHRNSRRYMMLLIV